MSTLFPFGYPLHLSTNAPEIEAVAAAHWGRYLQCFDATPMRLRVAVTNERSEFPPRPAVPQGHEHLVMTSHGVGNFAVCDLRRSLACISLTRDVAEDRRCVLEHFLEPFVCMMAAAQRFAIVHAACVALNGHAALLCGDSGSGKTCLAWTCARQGWTFLSGDATQLVRDSPELTVAGRPFSIRFRETARELFPELRGHSAALGPRGKLDIEVDPGSLGATVAQSAVASHLIVIDRSGRNGAVAEPVAAGEMRTYFDQANFYGPEALRRAQRNTFERFLNLPVLRLRYSHLDDAEKLLRSIVGGAARC